jgi:hypothetical protein
VTSPVILEPREFGLDEIKYLETPLRSGELELWRWRTPPQQAARVRHPGGGYGADRSLLPAINITVSVATSDPVIATRAHAVDRQAVERRIGVSCILGYRRGLSPVCWS